MNEILLELIKKVNTSTMTLILVLFLILLLLLFRFIIIHRKELYDWFLSYVNKKKETNDVIQLTYQLKKQVEKNTNEVKQYAENRIHDREQSFQKQADIEKNINSKTEALRTEVLNEINLLSEKLDIMQADTNRRVQAELKEKIRQTYQFYKDEKQWNYMEKEGFEGLIDEYERAGGTNSFVHTVIVPDIETWEIIETK